jgi:hypothetical protein
LGGTVLAALVTDERRPAPNNKLKVAIIVLLWAPVATYPPLSGIF